MPSPIGKTFTIVGFGPRNPSRVMEIVGLAGDAKYQRLREAAQPIMYSAFAQQRELFSGTRLAIRTIGAPMDSRNAIVAAITAVHKDIAVITAVGLIVGAAAAVGTGRFINTLLYNLASSDRTMIAITGITLASAAAIAGYLPAR